MKNTNIIWDSQSNSFICSRRGALTKQDALEALKEGEAEWTFEAWTVIKLEELLALAKEKDMPIEAEIQGDYIVFDARREDASWLMNKLDKTGGCYRYKGR